MEFLLTDYIAFFIIVAIGIIIGNIKIKGISFDSSAVIFIALVFGHFGVEIPAIIQQIGLILFIYSVGIQAGPGFFRSFSKNGLHLLLLTGVVIVTGALTTVGLALIYEIEFKMAVGLFTGALTSTSGLAAAIESTNSPIASIGFGIAYPFGVIGVILFVKLSPNIFKKNLKLEEEDYVNQVNSEHPTLANKNYIVSNPNIFGKSLSELSIRSITNTNISRILHDSIVIIPKPETVLNEGDLVRACGTEDDLSKLSYLVGEETNQKIPIGKKYGVKKFLVTNKAIVNSSLGKLGLINHYNATVTTIRRSGIDIIPNANSLLRFGDKVTITAPEVHLPEIGKLLGDSIKKFNELNFLPVSLGIILGILIGKITIPLYGEYSFSLGLTGGILISALLLSYIGKTGSVVWNISGTTNMFLRKIGLLFFLAAVGTKAGSHIVETFQTTGFKFFIIGAIITMIPMIVAMLVGLYVFKINFLTLVGSLTGSMTSTPALSATESMTESNAPQVAYAAVYPFALVLIIIVSQLMGKF